MFRCSQNEQNPFGFKSVRPASASMARKARAFAGGVLISVPYTSKDSMRGSAIRQPGLGLRRRHTEAHCNPPLSEACARSPREAVSLKQQVKLISICLAYSGPAAQQARCSLLYRLLVPFAQDPLPRHADKAAAPGRQNSDGNLMSAGSSYAVV